LVFGLLKEALLITQPNNFLLKPGMPGVNGRFLGLEAGQVESLANPGISRPTTACTYCRNDVDPAYGENGLHQSSATLLFQSRGIVGSRLLRLQHLLDSTSDLGNRTGFRQARHRTLIEEHLGLGVERIPSEKDNAPEQMRILAFQRAVETRAVDFRHAHITQQQVIGALSEFCQR
jgi:hypothetical protein